MSNDTASPNGRFAGMKAIAVGRYSSDPQRNSTTMDKQIELVRHYAKKNGIDVIDELRLEAMSASLSKHEPSLRKLIARKRAQNDFELVIFFDYSRFARKMRRGIRLWMDFEDAGITVLSTVDTHHTGELAPIHQILELFKHQSYVKQLATTVTSARSKAVKDGIITPVTNVMFGVDKLFLGPDREKLFVLRDTHDGFKVKLNPETGAVIEKIVKRRGEKAVFKKKSERVRPIPGDPAHVKAVNDIFRWFLIEKKKLWQISVRLNEQGLPTVYGSFWQSSTVKSILENTIYTGTAIGARESTGTYAELTADGVIVLETPREVPENRETIPAKFKEMDQWMIVQVPEMAEFLDSDVRDIAKTWQWDRLKAKQDRRSKRAANALNSNGRIRGGDRHDPNGYPLRGIMRSKQDWQEMRGWSTPSKRQKKRFRYYVIPKFKYIPVPGDVRRKGIPAEPVENTVVECLVEALSDLDGLDEMISKHISRTYKVRLKDRAGLPALESQRVEIAEEYRRLIKLPPRGRALVEQEIEQHEAKLKSIEDRIAAAKAEVGARPEDAEEITSVLKSQLAVLKDVLKEEKKLGTLREVFETFVSRCVADLETRHVEFDLALPGWAFSKRKAILEEVGLERSAVGSGFHQTKLLDPLILAKYQLSYSRKLLPYKGCAVSYASQRLPL